MRAGDILLALLALLAICCGVSAEQGWTTMTVYDVLQADCRHDVSNKNVGDPAGDAYFLLKDMYLPIACPKCQKSVEGCRGASTFDCNNPESNGDLVVREISIEVQEPFGTYKLCNEEGNGSSCDYRCDALTRTPVPGVGIQKVCGGDFHKCDMAPDPAYLHFWDRNKWDYWDFNAAVRLGAHTPSVVAPAGGQAPEPDNARGNGTWFSLASQDENKYWRNATIKKVINADCQRVQWLKVVEAAGQPCFGKCAAGANSSDPCYIECVFATTLGPNAGSTTSPTGGMAVADITTAWLAGFQSSDPAAGGCPACPDHGPCPTAALHDPRHAGRHRAVAPRAHAMPRA